jgi:hypothetical protein
MTHLLLALGLLACDGGEINTDDTGADTGDTEADADTDSDTDTDTDSDADGDTDVDELTFALSGDTDGVGISVVAMSFSDAGIAFGDTAGHATASGSSTTVTVANPSEDDLVVLTQDFPDMLAATYAAVLHDDDDGSLDHGDGEVVRGVGEFVPLYLVNVPGELAAFGFRDGWNAIKFGDDGDLPETVSIDEIPLSDNLAPQDLVLSGTNDVALLDWDVDVRMAVVPTTFFGGEPGVSPYLDQAFTDYEWSLTLDDAPPANHIDDESGLAIEFPIVYDDADGSGDLSDGDGGLLANTLCYDGISVLLAYSPLITDLEIAFFFASQGTTSGWQAGRNVPDGAGGEDYFPLTSEQASSLTVSAEECGL